jgi:hypothetical protein
MELVEVSATAMPIGSELDFEFHLSFGYRQAAHRARRIHAGAPPHTVRWSAWELALSDGFSGFPTKNLFIRHLSDSLSGCEGESKPDSPRTRRRKRQPDRPRWRQIEEYHRRDVGAMRRWSHSGPEGKPMAVILVIEDASHRPSRLQSGIAPLRCVALAFRFGAVAVWVDRPPLPCVRHAVM